MTDYNDKRISQEALNTLLKNNYQNSYQNYPTTNIKALLAEQGYEPVFENLTIEPEFMLYNADFSGISFDHCVFRGTFSKIKFADGNITNTRFDHAYFNNAEFGHLTDFIDTSFTDTYFQNSVFDQNIFQNNTLSYTGFYNTTSTLGSYENVSISHSNLLGLTFSEAQHIQVTLDNTVFRPETVQAFSKDEIRVLHGDAPVIGLISRPAEIIYEGEVGMTAQAPYSSLKQYGTTSVLLDMSDLQKKINLPELIQEIQTIVNRVPEGVNIPQYFLSQQAENLDKIKLAAQDYAQYLDAAWIPGGPDVHPEFYGQSDKGSYLSDSSYVREIFEFTLIDEMVKNDKPLMGICHGSQIANVYFGGTLRQDVDGHHENHLVIPLNTTTGVVSEVLKAPTIGVSNHHQAIDKIGEGLQIVAYSGPVIENFIVDHNKIIETVVEASEGAHGEPIMLFQFHPEYNQDQGNRDIVTQFVELAKQYHQNHDAEIMAFA